MLQRLTVLLIALLLLAVGCSSTTVISEGMLQAPAADDAASSALDSVDLPDADASQTDERGDRNLGDTDDESTDTESTEPDADTEPEAEADTESADDDELDFGLGGDDQIASLLADCEDGSDMACDILYSTSPVGSDEEATALTCGGRSDVEVRFCTEGIESAFGNVWFAESSPGLPAALASCEDGDMTACDFLYFRSEIGSEYEEVGNTCGGRTAVALPDCRTAFG